MDRTDLIETKTSDAIEADMNRQSLADCLAEDGPIEVTVGVGTLRLDEQWGMWLIDDGGHSELTAGQRDAILCDDEDDAQEIAEAMCDYESAPDPARCYRALAGMIREMRAEIARLTR